MASITVPGTGGSTVSVSAVYSNVSNAAVANQIAGLLNEAANGVSGLSLVVSSVGGSGTVPPPVTTPGTVNELLLGSVSGGVVSIPSSGSTGYVVVYDSQVPVTIEGSANTTVLGGSGNITIIDPSVVVVGDNATGPGANDTIVLTGADSNSSATGNNGNDTITASAANDSISSGSGENLLTTSGASNFIRSNGNDTVVASGDDDTVFGGVGQDFITGTGNNQVLDGKSSGTVNIMSTGQGSKIGLSQQTGFAAVTLMGGAQSISGGPGQLTALVISSVAGAGGTTSGSIGLGAGGAAITLEGANNKISAGSGATSVLDLGNNDNIGGSTGALAITQAGSGGQVFAGSGGITAVMSGNNAAIHGSTTAGNAGNIAATLSGSNDAVGTGKGSTSLFITGNDAVINSGTGPVNIVQSGGSGLLVNMNAGQPAATIALENTTGATINGNTGFLSIIVSGAGTDTINLSSGASNITAGDTSVLDVNGGSGSITFIAGSGNSSVIGGAGGATLFGGAGGDLTYQSGSTSNSPLFYIAGGGNETLNASASVTNDSLSGGTVAGSTVSIAGGNGADTYSAGAGTDSFAAGTGANVFLFTKAVINGNAPQDVITGWQNADNVVLSGYGTIDQAVTGTSSSSGNTTITLNDGTTIKFIGVGSAFDLGGHFTTK